MAWSSTTRSPTGARPQPEGESNTMKITKLLAATAASALIAGGGVLLTATAASAHTPAVSATCEALSVNLTNYAPEIEHKDAVPPVYKDWDETVHHDAVGEPTIANPNYVAPKDAVPATYATEYEYKKWVGLPVLGHWNYNWFPESAKPDAHSGWIKTGNTRQGAEITPAIPAQPAVGEPTIPNPDYQEPRDEVVPHHDLVTPGQDEVLAQSNHVLVTIDGSVVADESFGTTWAKSFPFAGKYTAHTYNVKVSGYDDQGNLDKSGTSTACEKPVVDGKAGAKIETTCGSATVTLTNEQGEDEVNRTVAPTIWIDGKFTEAVAVTGGATEQRTYKFREDSGEHTIVVKDSEFNGGAKLAEAKTGSNCQPDTPTKPEQPGNPGTPQQPSTPAPAAPAAGGSTPAPVAAVSSSLDSADTLAHTGYDVSPYWVLGGAGAAAAGLVLVIAAARHRRRSTQE